MLESCTTEIKEVDVQIDEKTVTLIDTPGFDVHGYTPSGLRVQFSSAATLQIGIGMTTICGNDTIVFVNAVLMTDKYSFLGTGKWSVRFTKEQNAKQFIHRQSHRSVDSFRGQ